MTIAHPASVPTSDHASANARVEAEAHGGVGAAVGAAGAVGLLCFVSALGGSALVTSATLFTALLGSAVVAVLLVPAFRAGAEPVAVVMSLIGMFYLPSLCDAVTLGSAPLGVRVTAHGLTWAVLGVTLQLAVSSMAVWWGQHSIVLRGVAGAVTGGLDARRIRGAFLLAVLVLFGLSAMASIRSGGWSYYAPGAVSSRGVEVSGGFRLELMYSSLALALCVVVGDRLARTRKSSWRDAAWWRGLALALALMLFVLQSRRLLMAGVMLMVFPVLPGVFGDGSIAARVRRVALLGVAAGALGILLYGSSVWRATNSRRGDDAATHLKNMAQTSLSTKEVVTSARGRLAYLTMDAAAFEMLGRHVHEDRLFDALLGEAVGNIPALLYPDKYRVPRVTCESLFRLDVPHVEDLPCTPIGEGVLLGGLVGLGAVLAAWTLALALTHALYAARCDAGGVLAVLAVTPLFDIESSAFPVVRSLRSLVVTAGLLWPMVIAAEFILRRARSDGFARR